ncbi:MAG TPA: FAD-dependent monooxygenase [Steroidobacteraceae bacterium]|nr:FAD-dependent monooxygenase [Steroidobacteraceae bacterium]
MTRADILIVGAGPTGLVLALWLTRLGVAVRIIDKLPEPVATSRALAVQARTLELYRQTGLDAHLIEHGHRVPAINLWTRGEAAARVTFESIGADLTPYPFGLVFPQDEHERLLIERLRERGVSVDRGTELVGLVEQDGQVRARVRGPDGLVSDWEAYYVAGCDGARSMVRTALGTSFPGGTYRQVFYVADIDGTGPVVNGELHVDLDEADFLAVFPLVGQGRARLVGTIRDERADHAETLRFEDVSQRAIQHLKVQVQHVNWFSTYRVHHRVSDHFRRGRAFLLGDAGHIHSPAGGQGMNTGIGDAINLAWKLASVLRGAAPDDLLDSYEAERIGFARRLVATTDRVFTFATAEGHIADILRTRVTPVVFPKVMAFDAVREFVFKTAAQITINYRGSPMSAGTAGHVHGGDRLPWVHATGLDNFEALSCMSWQVHVYGTARPELRQWCADRKVPIHVYPWQAQCAAAGFAQDALYLLRPDTYVGLADSTGTPDAIERYCAQRKLGSLSVDS